MKPMLKSLTYAVALAALSMSSVTHARRSRASSLHCPTSCHRALRRAWERSS